ncbi:CAP domain-containing protein [Kribbella jiaozuonensis]|uniref:CAP domain-containing protein n=1 Tax=Kribbella jiaozuonensis TaxID=2575441 RepID=A0A4U3M073_9ACTN|nr:CAP domain-containing protein [Kribbella jiaozuonensis]TKK82058.1 CAP domain-containing protein [Kribbella jiaozuonensis]
MTDSPTPRRHRGSRRAPRRSRGLVGPVVSALSVLLAIGPVVWLMSHDNSRTDDAAKVLNVSEDTRVDGGSGDGTKAGTPLITVTKTLPNGRTTTSVVGTPALGPGATSSSTSATPTSPGTPSDTPTDVLTTPTSPTVGVTTVTVPPTSPGSTRTTSGGGRPKPSYPTKTASTTPTKTRTTEPTDTPPPPPSGGGTSTQERQVLDYTNQIRQQQGCGPLRLDSALVEAAGKHASDMVRRHYMDHTNPDGQDPGDRMAAAGYRGSSWGENIAAGYDTAQKVVAAWMQSDGHRKNILNCRFTTIGIGYDPGQVKSNYGPGSWVQDFGRS